MSNRVFIFVFLIFILLGGFFALHLSRVENLETFKVLNVIGLFYDMMGLVILSEVLSSSERFQKFIADIFSGLFMWAHMGIPIGVLLTSFALFFFEGFPSAKVTMGVGGGFLFWMILPSFVIEDVVFVAKTKRFQSPQSRSRFFGGFLLISGLLVQFIAALQDLGI